ncbi:unnamed protein product [Paramecium primaurelia]|uniref:UBC core domain-containing protein n=1 Tax=Paramecium primaurelia TaxID=5886 RepID=A0A8S1Q281_PARPR|nr:unnamed protein product [Paramecium primaurelia]
MLNRVNKEIKDLTENPTPGVEVYQDKEDRLKIHFTLSGLGSPLENQIIPFWIDVPQNYPFSNPFIKIKKIIFHPLYFNDRAECCDCWCKSKWQPSHTIKSLINDLIDILLMPRVSHPNIATSILNHSRFEYFETALMYYKEEKQWEQSEVNFEEIVNLPCKLNHSRPIVEVIIDKNFKSDEMLICQLCQLSIGDIKRIDINQLQQNLVCNRRNRNVIIEDLENKFLTQIDNFQKCIEKIQDLDNQVFQELLYLKNDWIVSSLKFKQKLCSLTILEEIELIKYEPKEYKKQVKQEKQQIDGLFLQKIYSCIDKLVLQQNRQNLMEVIQNIFNKPQLKFKFHNIRYEFIRPNRMVNYTFSINSDNTLMVTSELFSGSMVQIYQIVKGQNDGQYQISYLRAQSFRSRIIYIKFLFKQKFTFVITTEFRGLYIMYPIEYNGEEAIKWDFKQYIDDCEYVNCLEVRQSDDLIVTGHKNGNIMFYISTTNQPIQKITESNTEVWGLSFNQSGNMLLSCQQNNEIFLMMEQKEGWSIKQKILMDGFGYRLSFITDQIFAIQTRTPKPHNQIYIYTSDSNGQFIKSGSLFVNGGNQPCEIFFPMQYIPSKQLLISKNGYYLNVLKLAFSNQSRLDIERCRLEQSIYFGTNFFYGTVSNNGEFIISMSQAFPQQFNHSLEILIGTFKQKFQQKI